MDETSYFALKTRFIAAFRSDESPSDPAIWFIFQGEKLLVDIQANDTNTICRRSPQQLGLVPIFSQFLGRDGLMLRVSPKLP